ncbi:hypothetical protein H1V43_10345 [Streptomyces sp. PSKA54]|uniref:Uncharacterized protein n=1 Tax=Streptomyces himalayensis subsp. aureolus TaxID=2758039 RepID=A0A7W2HFB0_9ACTN|nr:hypothetical protein [Streptomyces himalayensis]MBA4861778.1 hypothetical protein [Streptomyces himalayensis subsp. aureolus]
MTGGPGDEAREPLEDEYAEAFAEWDGTEDAVLWDRFVADGLDDDEGWAP